jgi:hypothetical protein
MQRVRIIHEKALKKNARVMYSVSTAFNCECLAGTIEQFD